MSISEEVLFNFKDVLDELAPSSKQDTVIGFQGVCRYCHYGEQATDDRGWGCGYRTLQTLIDWRRRNGSTNGNSTSSIPTLLDIQRALVEMQDKAPDFVGSRNWIGSFEASICVDFFTNTLCKVHYVAQGSFSSDDINVLKNHFAESGSPVMMGGLTDTSSKCLLAVTDSELLVMDPHYYGPTSSLRRLCADKWIRWTPIRELCETSYYNMCLPLKR